MSLLSHIIMLVVAEAYYGSKLCTSMAHDLFANIVEEVHLLFFHQVHDETFNGNGQMACSFFECKVSWCFSFGVLAPTVDVQAPFASQQIHLAKPFSLMHTTRRSTTS